MVAMGLVLGWIHHQQLLVRAGLGGWIARSARGPAPAPPEDRRPASGRQLVGLAAVPGEGCHRRSFGLATACAALAKIAAQRETLVKELNIREMRASLGQLAELVAAEGELVIRRRGEPIARVLPMSQQRRPPDHADLRRRMPLLKTTSADLIRDERDEC